MRNQFTGTISIDVFFDNESFCRLLLHLVYAKNAGRASNDMRFNHWTFAADCGKLIGRNASIRAGLGLWNRRPDIKTTPTERYFFIIYIIFGVA